MHSNLLQKAFQKAQDTILSEKPTHLSRYLSDYIFEDSGEQFGEKSLRNYHKYIEQGKVVNLKPFVVESLCHFLGYDSYGAYVISVPKEKIKRTDFEKQSVVSKIFTVIVVFFFFLAFIFSCSKTRKPICEVLTDWQNTIEHHFYRMERLMRYLQGEAA